MSDKKTGAMALAVDLVKHFEGLSLAPYVCPAGLPTVGYGHVILSHENELRGGVTIDEACELLERDLAWAMREALSVGRDLTAGQAAGLASLIYNIGQGAWRKSTIRGLVVDGDFDGAAAQFDRWNRGGGKVLQGLVARRAAEKNTFLGVI